MGLLSVGEVARTSGQGLIADRLPVAHLLNNLAFAMWCDGKGSSKRRWRATLTIMAGKAIVDDGQTVTKALGLVNVEGLVLLFSMDTSQPVVS
jgi:hypothetical protein